MERSAHMDAEGARALLRRALEADSGFLPAHYQHIKEARWTGVAAEYDAAGDARPFVRCTAAWARASEAYPATALPELRALDGPHADRCTATLLAAAARELAPLRTWSDRVLAYGERATRTTPALAVAWLARSAALRALGRGAERRAVVLEALRHVDPALERIALHAELADIARVAGDTARAVELARAIAAAVERDPRTGLHFEWPVYVTFNGSATGQPVAEAQARERLRVALASGGPGFEFTARRSLGSLLSDAGSAREALEHFERLVRIADSLAVPLLQLEAYRFRGRAQMKLGRLHDAERDLMHALRVGTPTGDVYYLAEAWHNLAHVYEGLDRMVEAAAAVDRFIALARPLEAAQPRMMSLRDAGLIRWKAGWPATANAAFAEMVRVVDQQQRNHFWAGEYFERIGDLPRALGYYRRGAALDPLERSLNLGGLARVHETLGHADSAEAAARAHDLVMSNQLDVPLLPAVLARQGHHDDAVRSARAWLRRQVEQGNLQGEVRARLALADLLFGAGRIEDARSEAAAAESTAASVHLAEEGVRAARLHGAALVRAGRMEGLEKLRHAVARAGALPTADERLLSRLALADALALHGGLHEALAAYDGAAATVESTLAQLAHDLERVRFRERQLAPFDGAVRLLLRAPPDSANLDALVSWSGRRKAAALALATAAVAPDPAVPAGVRGLRARLADDAALIDYVALDAQLVAIVVTARRVTTVRLPASPDSVRALAERLRRPLTATYAGSVDLARAHYDLALGHELHRVLLAPIEPLLRDARRLAIVPDGPLHLVPFDALVTRPPPAPGAYGAAAFAIDSYEIVLLPAARFLTHGGAPPARAGGGILAVSYDAPGADDEAAAVLNAWPPGRVRRLSGEGASESAVRDLAPGHTVLHFAAHARADDREPEASHLRLARDDRNDGVLHLAEIAAAGIAARLIVLSACETLSGRLFAGEGLMGLARAFLVGGAGAVVATQWPVGPAAAPLMGRFHRALAGGATPAAALRAARLALRADPATAHPFYWAGFVLVEGPGAGDLVSSSNRQSGLRSPGSRD